MKRIIISMIILSIISECLITTVMATPEILEIRGGFGVIAEVSDADHHNWKIELIGLRIFKGSITEGVVDGKENVTLRTPIFPPALGFGVIDIKVTLLFYWLPVDMEKRSAFMLGPLVMFVSES